MLELMPIIKQLADIGITAPAAVGIALLWKINKNFVDHDRRISILEAFHIRRKTD